VFCLSCALKSGLMYISSEGSQNVIQDECSFLHLKSRVQVLEQNHPHKAILSFESYDLLSVYLSSCIEPVYFLFLY
jgi:hypothetical protein